MSIRWRLLFVVALAACGDEAAVIVDAHVADARPDAAAIDAATDAAIIDAPAIDAPLDADLTDAAIDGADAPLPDASPDAALIDASLLVDAALVDGVSPDADFSPHITDVFPRNGLAAGGTTVGVSGDGLFQGTVVTFNGVTATCQFVSSSNGTCTTAAGAPGRGPVAVSNLNGASTSPVQWTYTAAANETDAAAEADFCNLQFPSTITVASTAGHLPDLYGRIYEAGRTEALGEPSGVIAEIGWGPGGSSPITNATWRFFATPYNVQVGNDDEYYAHNYGGPSTPGTYAYTFRMSLDGGLTYTYCDLDGAGANPTLTFSASQLGVMTVTP